MSAPSSSPPKRKNTVHQNTYKTNIVQFVTHFFLFTILLFYYCCCVFHKSQWCDDVYCCSLFCYFSIELKLPKFHFILRLSPYIFEMHCRDEQSLIEILKTSQWDDSSYHLRSMQPHACYCLKEDYFERNYPRKTCVCV